jgi:hypothetical protein
MGEYSIDVLLKDNEQTLLEKLEKNVGSSYREAILYALQRRHLLDVARETAILADSSKKMEELTKKLQRYTIWLMIFAFVQIVVAGVQTWKLIYP